MAIKIGDKLGTTTDWEYPAAGGIQNGEYYEVHPKELKLLYMDETLRAFYDFSCLDINCFLDEEAWCF